MNKSSRIEFTYEYQGFAAIQPLHPYTDRRRYMRRKKKSKTRFVRPEYPKFPLGTALDTRIEDIRQHGIKLTGKYTGKISIELKEIKHGGKVNIGSLIHRKDQAQQYLFRIQEGRAYHNIWMGMPIAIFNITMDISIPNEQYESIIGSKDMLDKITPEEVAKLQIENNFGKILEQLEKGFDIDLSHVEDNDENDEEKQLLKEINKWIKDFIPEQELRISRSRIEKILDETSKEHNEFVELIIKSLSEEDVRKKWARQLGDLDQDLLKDTKLSGKKKKESRIRRKARRDLKTIKKSDQALTDIFKIFRFYMNTYLSSVKYLLGQYWMQLLPDWEADTFYTDNEVKLDDFALVKQPMYTIGSLTQYAPKNNIFRHQWSAVRNLNFGQMMALSTGFTTEGIFVKAYEALSENEAEICIVLLDIGLEFAFRNLTANLTEEGKLFAEKINLPNTTDTDLSFGDLIDLCQKSFEMITSKLHVSRSRIRKLWKHIEFIHLFRNLVIHRKTIIRKYISSVTNTPGRELSEDTIIPYKYDIDLELDPENIRHFKPYWWRVINHVWHSAYDVFKMTSYIKWGFLSPKEYEPPKYPTFVIARSSREIVFNKICMWLARIFRVKL